jgi:hypothetical protein
MPHSYLARLILSIKLVESQGVNPKCDATIEEFQLWSIHMAGSGWLLHIRQSPSLFFNHAAMFGAEEKSDEDESMFMLLYVESISSSYLQNAVKEANTSSPDFLWK